jgi:protein subunit release factor A
LRAVSLAEKKIEKLETKIADFEKTMGKSDFFQSPDQQTVINKYNEAKTNLDSAMEEWEKAQLMIEEAGA